LGVRDDIPMASHFTVLLLDISDGADALQHFYMERISHTLSIRKLGNRQYLINPFKLRHFSIRLKSFLSFLMGDNPLPQLIMLSAILPDIHTGKMKTEYFNL